MKDLVLALMILFAVIALPAGAQNETGIVPAVEESADSQSEHTSPIDAPASDPLTELLPIFGVDPEIDYASLDENVLSDESPANEELTEEETNGYLNSLIISYGQGVERSGPSNEAETENIEMENNSEQTSSEELNQTADIFDQLDVDKSDFDQSELVIPADTDTPLADQVQTPMEGEIVKIFRQYNTNQGNEGANKFISGNGVAFGGNSTQNNFTEDLMNVLVQSGIRSAENVESTNQAVTSIAYPVPEPPKDRHENREITRDQYQQLLSYMQRIREFADGSNAGNQNIAELSVEMDSKLSLLQNPNLRRDKDPPALPVPYWGSLRLLDTVSAETPVMTDISIRDDDPKNYAVVVGINKYSDRRDLRASVNDAEKMAKILRELYHYEVILLTDKTVGKPPSKHNILEGALAEIKAKPNRGEVLFYFSGHGEVDDEGNFYLIPQDANGNPSSYISEEELNKYVKDMKGLSLIVDACYSGGLYKNKNQERYDDRQEKKEEQGQLIFKSSREDEPSNEMWNETNSVFTYYLCQAIKHEVIKGDRQPLQASIQNCFTQVRDNTLQWSRSNFLSQNQTPILTLA